VDELFDLVPKQLIKLNGVKSEEFLEPVACNQDDESLTFLVENAKCFN
jgi:hypothetical protein